MKELFEPSQRRPVTSHCLYIFHVIVLPQILKGAATIEGRPGESLEALDFDSLKQSLEEKHETTFSDEDVMSAALYPKVGYYTRRIFCVVF